MFRIVHGHTLAVAALLGALAGSGGCDKKRPERCYKQKSPAACKPLCDQGRARACYALGERYWYTSGHQDHDRSFRWYGRACALRSRLPRTTYPTAPSPDSTRDAVATACYKVGHLYEQPSDHVKGGAKAGKKTILAPRKEDRLQALLHFRRACDLAHAEACQEVAEAFHGGQGAPRDPRAAWRYYARACDLGKRHSCLMAARIGKSLR